MQSGNIIPFPAPSDQKAKERILSALSANQSDLHVKEEMLPRGSRSPMDKIKNIEHITNSGRVGPFAFVAQDQLTGLFYTEVETGDRNARKHLFALIGVLEAVKMELLEKAALAPTLDSHGGIIDPYQNDSEASQ